MRKENNNGEIEEDFGSSSRNINIYGNFIIFLSPLKFMVQNMFNIYYLFCKQNEYFGDVPDLLLLEFFVVFFFIKVQFKNIL